MAGAHLGFEGEGSARELRGFLRRNPGAGLECVEPLNRQGSVFGSRTSHTCEGELAVSFSHSANDQGTRISDERVPGNG